MKLPAITKLNRDKMKVMAQFAIDLIRRDANDGIFQNDTGPHDYGSHGDTLGNAPIGVKLPSAVDILLGLPLPMAVIRASILVAAGPARPAKADCPYFSARNISTTTLP